MLRVVGAVLLFLCSAGVESVDLVQLQVSTDHRATPPVSVLAIQNPQRRGFQWNTLVNFYKQDYAGHLELVVVDSSDSFKDDSGSHMSKKMSGDANAAALAEEGLSKFDLMTHPAFHKMDTSLASSGDKHQALFGKGPNRGGPRSIIHVNATGALGKLRNQGINASSGTIITGFDDDDVYDFGYVTQFVHTLQNNNKAKLAYPKKALMQHFSLDGSVKTHGYKANAKGAGNHAFYKDVYPACAYGGVQATEESQLVDCIEKTYSADSLVPLDGTPANGVGYIKLQWSGGICAHVWSNDVFKQQYAKASLMGYKKYVKRILQNIHFLQEMNGGARALDMLREKAPKEMGALSEATIPGPAEDVKVDKSDDAATCQSWDILLQTSDPTSLIGAGSFEKKQNGSHVRIDVGPDDSIQMRDV